MKKPLFPHCFSHCFNPVIIAPILLAWCLCFFPLNGHAIDSASNVEEKFQRLLDETVTSGVPGIVMRVQQNGSLFWEGASGYADLSNLIPMSPNLQFRIGSITKTFVAALVLKLVEENRLSLYDPIERWLPGIVPNANQITIQNLLNMTSGLYSYETDLSFQMSLFLNPLKQWHPTELIEIALQHDPLSPPGTQYEYSNTNYVILGLLIEKITGNSLEEELRKRFTDPLTLSDTFFGSYVQFPKEGVHGYADYDEDGELDDYTEYDMSGVFGTGFGISTAADLCRWIEGLCAGDVLLETSRQAMTTTIDLLTVPGIYQGYGLGLFKIEYSEEITGFPFTVYGHNGGIYGYFCWILYSPELNLSIAILSNIDEDLEEMRLYSVFFQTVSLILERASGIDCWELLN